MGRYGRVVQRPTSPPTKPHCAACMLTLDYLRARMDTYECSRVECPQRRAITAAPMPTQDMEREG